MPGNTRVPWYARLLIGAAAGSILGVFSLSPDVSLTGVMASAASGAVFLGLLGMGASLASASRFAAMMLGAGSGALGAVVWSLVFGVSLLTPVVVGVVLGAAICGLEFGPPRSVA